MRRLLLYVPLITLLIVWSSCRKDFDFEDSVGTLQFSRDTVFLDTVFSGIGSSTRSVWVYNTSNTDVNIPSVRLANGPESTYRLNVDGQAGKAFTNVPLRAKDSLFIFIETTVSLEENGPSGFLSVDAILFDEGPTQQEIVLVTLVQNAIFLFPNKVPGQTAQHLTLALDMNGNPINTTRFELADPELHFTNALPYIIYGYASVPPNKTLHIDAGARVYFHANSGVLISPEANLVVEGTLSTDTLALENEVIFEADRLEPEFADIPGQWGGIWFQNGSSGILTHLTVKNAEVGILAEGNAASSPTSLVLKNTQIYNSAVTNLWGKQAQLRAENLVLGSSGNSSLVCESGGDYSFNHCTIANYWINGFRNASALRISNFGQTSLGEPIVGDLEQAQFTNCIIDGNRSLELELESNTAQLFNFNFTHCLLKFDDSRNIFTNNPLYTFENPEFYNALWLNPNTEFKNVRVNDFRIGAASTAVGNAEMAMVLQIPTDILGKDRTATPDIGAYRHCFPE